MLNIITTEKKWSETLKKFDSYDFYHTYEYHQLSKKNNEKAVLLSYDEDEVLIALPLIIRPIKNTIYYDATSVYGYAGPLVNTGAKEFDNSNLRIALDRFFKEKKIISVFSRLNPFIKNQEIILNNIGRIQELGKVVNIDLTQDLSSQKAIYSKTTKRYLNKVRKSCHTRISAEKEDILQFISLYYENMDRVNAKKEYYFSESYFMRFIASKQFKCEVLFAILNETNEIIAAAMMVKTNGKIIQYHISGTANKYLHLTPIRLLIDEMRIIGTQEKYAHFNLGGGLGNQEDNLFKFKASFSKDFKQFKLWKHIVDKETYLELCAKNNSLKGLDEQTDFFPLYRYG